MTRPATARADVSARKTYDLVDEPLGADYDALLDTAVTQCAFIVLRTRASAVDASAASVLAQLEPHRERRVDSPSGVAHHFRLNRGTVAVLKSAARALFAWQPPDRPADLCLLRADGSPWLVSIAAERLGYLELAPFEKLLLGRAAPGFAAVLAHHAARDAILASFERGLEAHLEALTEEAAYHARRVIDEGREDLCDALAGWLGSRDESRVHVALEVIAELRLAELRDEVVALQRSELAAALDDPEAYGNAVLRERWHARRRRLLARTLRRLDGDAA